VVWTGGGAVAISWAEEQELGNGRVLPCHRERLPHSGSLTAALFAMTPYGAMTVKG